MKDILMKLNPGLPWKKQHSIRRNQFSPVKWDFKQEIAKCYIWSIFFCGAEDWTLRKVE